MKKQIDYKYIEYPTKVLNGEIVACELVKKACSRYMAMLDRDDLIFDTEQIDKCVKFVNKFHHYTSSSVGKKFILSDWQFFIVCWIYGFWKPDGKRLTRYAYIEVARKALALDTKVFTTNRGWQTIGSIQIGDKVYDENGNECNVVNKSEIFDGDCYKVKFKNGQEVIADAQHEWLTDSWAKSTKVRTTEEMAKDYTCKHSQYDDYMSYKYSVPCSPIIPYSEKELPIDPYTLGFWLGDGHSKEARFTVCGDDIDEELEYLKEANRDPHKVKKYSNGENAYDVNYLCTELQNKLIECGLKNNKHIPDDYIYSSVEQRIQLLQGLLDADGHISKDKYRRIEIQQKNVRIADGICKILSSLGIPYYIATKIPTINGVPKDAVKRIEFQTTKSLPLFRLKRKYDLLPDKLRRCRNNIISIEHVDSVPVQCITVDSPSHLFCFGEKFVPTHNCGKSAFVAVLGLYEAFAFGEAASEVEVAANSRAQASLLFDKCSEFIKELDPKQRIIRVIRNKIKCPALKSSMNCLSAEAGKLDGLNAHCVLLDEVHESRDNKMFNVLQSSMGQRTNPIFIMTTTSGFDLNGFGHQLYQQSVDILNGIIEDDTWAAFIYTLDEGDNFEDENVWIKAVPNLDVTVARDFMRNQVTQAKNNPVLRSGVLTKNFNMWLSSSYCWIPDNYVKDCMTDIKLEDFKGMNAFVGLDLSAVSDLTALSVMIPADDKFYFWSEVFLPEETIENSPNREMYKYWRDNGYLHVTQGRVIDTDAIVKRLVEISQIVNIQGIGYDAWGSTQLTMKANETELEGLMIPVSQSIGKFSRGHKFLETIILNGQAVMQKNPIVRWNFANIVLQEDMNGNVKGHKSSVQSDQKIDTYISMCECLLLYLDSPMSGASFDVI